jgi:proline dehydrogenase
MESSQYTDSTLALVTRLHRQYKACGTVIQAYLRRSAGDIECLEAEGIRVRLCKGAYLETPPAAFAQKSEVDRNYLELARSLLVAGEYPAIATHDDRIIGEVESFVGSHALPRDRFEFQMLYGIRRDLQRRLVQDGYRLRLYVPFGEAWYPYFMRRLAERPANLLFFARHLLRS